MRIPHILRTLGNFLVFLDSDFFRISFDHLLSVTNLFKQHPSHMRSQKILKSPKKWRIGTSHSSYPCEFFSIFGFGFLRKSFHHLLCVTNIFKQYTSHMMSQKILKTPNKWRIGKVRSMCGFLTFFVPLLMFEYFWIWIFPEII